MAEVATLLAWLVCCLIWGLSMGALRSKYATDSWQMLHVTRGTLCHHWGQLGITGPLSDSPVSSVRITMGQNVAWYGTPPETWTSLMCWWRWSMEKDLYIYIYILNQNIKDTGIFIYIYIYTQLCDSSLFFWKKIAAYWSLHRGCRLPWSTALFHRWPGALTEHDQWIQMVFGCFLEQWQQGRKGNRFESTQIQFI